MTQAVNGTPPVTPSAGGESKRGSGILLICARLFSYHERIGACLESMGYTVTWWDPRPSVGTAYRIALRLAPHTVSALSASSFEAKLRQLDAAAIEHVLVVKGEGLSPRAVSALRRRLPHARMTLYLWDGLDNARGSTAIAPHFDSVSTFDPVDAVEHGWAYRPLFADAGSHGPLARNGPALYDCAFIGTMHSDRHRVLSRVRAAHPTWRIFAFCYFQSRFMLGVRMCLDPTLWRAPKGTLGTKTLDRSEVDAVFNQSRVTLDIEHPGQRGLTMRTIETLLAGRKLVTTNRLVLSSDLYHPSRVCVIDRNRPRISDEFLAQQFEPLDDAIRRRYTLRCWAEEVLSIRP